MVWIMACRQSIDDKQAQKRHYFRTAFRGILLAGELLRSDSMNNNPSTQDRVVFIICAGHAVRVLR